jgi:alanine racemase
LEAVFTHFPVADTDAVYTKGQIERFDQLVSHLKVPLIHIANTPGALLFPEANRDFSRIGLGTYGLHPCDATRGLVDLRPAMSIVSHVSHVQRLPAGSRPSYGRRRALADDATVVTVPIGYADGYSRLLSDQGRVMIGGTTYALSGTVTMDQTLVTVGDADVAVGDEVILMGGSSISADEWARIMGTISYEVVCSIGPRVPRRYAN